MVIDIFIIALVAVVTVIILGMLAKIHEQVNEIESNVQKITAGIKVDGRLVMERMEKIETLLYRLENRFKLEKAGSPQPEGASEK